MSQDQRPAKMKAVSVAKAPPPAGAGNPANDGAQDDPATGSGPAAARPASGPSRLSAILFLIGCVAGGAGMAALPHLAPGLAASLGGHP